MSTYLNNRLKYHTASRVGAQTGYSLAQALDPDGHIVRHTSVWTAETAQFPVNTIASIDPEKATTDLVDVFFTQFVLTADLEFDSDKKYYRPVKTPVEEGSDELVVVDYEEDESIVRVDSEGNPLEVPADTYYERVAVVTYKNGDTWTEDSNIIAPVAGRVYRNDAYPAVELFYQVKMSGVSGSDAAGTYQAYEIKEGGKRVMDWVAPTAVIDPATGSPVAGFSGIAEASVEGTWTVLQKVPKWALSTGSWEFIPMAGMLTFDPSVTPGDTGANSTVRFTGFKYIGSTLDVALSDLEDKVFDDIADGYEGSMADLNAAISAEASARNTAVAALQNRATTLEGKVDVINGDAQTAGSIAKAEADAKAHTDSREAVLQGNINTLNTSKVDKVAGSSLIAVTEIEKLANYPAYSKIDSDIAAKADAATTYTKTEVDNAISAAKASVLRYQGTATKAELDAITADRKITVNGAERTVVSGDVYHVVAAGTNGAGAEFVWNGESWEELGTAVDLTNYYTKSDVYTKAEANSAISTAVAAEQSRAEGVETTLDGAITLLNGDEQTAGSVAHAVKAEETRAKGVEDELRTAVAANTTAINTLNGDAQTTGSVAKAVADEAEARRSGDETNAALIASNFAAIETLNGDAQTTGSVAKAVADEAAIARANEQTLTTAIGNEETDRINADTSLSNRIAAEQSRASDAENALDGRLDTVEDDIETLTGDANTEGSVAAAVAAEQSRAEGVETTLDGRLDNVEGAITTLNSGDTTSGSVAKTVKDAVDAEATARSNADTILEGKITAEQSRAEGVEAGFNTRIAANEAALAALGSVDGGSIANALAGKVDTTTYATDKAALEGSDAALAERVTTNEGAIEILNGDVNTEGSVAKQIADAVAEEAATARAAERANAEDIAALQVRASTLESANSYEFVSAVNAGTVAQPKVLGSKMYIVRNIGMIANLPAPADVTSNFMVRVLVNESASAQGGVIYPTGSHGADPNSGDPIPVTINGQASLPLNAVMDAVLLYDSANGDWFVLTTMF